MASYSAKQNGAGVGSPFLQELTHLRPHMLGAGANRRWESACKAAFSFCAEPLHLLQQPLFLPLSFLWFGLGRFKPSWCGIIGFWFNHRLLTLCVALISYRPLNMKIFVFLNIYSGTASFQKGFMNYLDLAHFSIRCESRSFWKGSIFEMQEKDAAPAAVLCWRTCPNPCLLVCCTAYLLHPLLSTLSISLVLFPPEGFWAEGKVKVWDLSTCGSFHLVATGTLLHWCHILSSFSSLWFSGPFELSLHLLAGWGKLNNTQECNSVVCNMLKTESSFML